MRRFIVFIIMGLFICTLKAQNNWTQYVKPFVGTGGHGHTFPGATLPFAMVQLSPDTRIDGSWDGCSGYHYSDSVIYGFSHTHLSGTGCSDYGDIAFMPRMGKKSMHPQSVYSHAKSNFSHKNETASPGYYSVLLKDGIHVELTVTQRVGVQKYTFQNSGYVWVTLDLKHRDELMEGKITQVDKRNFSGLRRSKAWAQNQAVWYYFRLSKDADQVNILKDEKGEYLLQLGFPVVKNENLLIQTALSSVDEEGALLNLNKEAFTPGELSNSFKYTRINASESWNTELDRIQVSGGSLEEKQNFYTALYHCMIHPNIMNDVDGRYRGRDGKIHKAEGFDYYTVFSLWDTYRALHPLLNIIDKKRSHDFIMTFKAQYEQSGRLPMWELWGNETNCMIGFHSVSVILDAYKKGVINLKELESLYPAVKAEAMSDRFGLDKFRDKGFLSVEDESESVSKTLEYSYDMWCMGELARLLSLELSDDKQRKPYSMDYILFKNYSDAWINLYNTHSGFFTPRSNGNWIERFDPRQVNNHYTEANAWQYRFAIPHQFNKIINDSIVSSMFNMTSTTTGRDQSDITGLMGQYAHGNEPSHHVAYLFKNKDSIAKYVGQICHKFYQPLPDGLCGNEDCGQMSAWYVFSAMGFYPVCPGDNVYVHTKPIFDSIVINGNDLDSLPFNRIRIPEKIERPKKILAEQYLRQAPIISADTYLFKDSLLITISGLNLNANPVQNKEKLVYAINDSEFKPYVTSFYINQSAKITAMYADTFDKNDAVPLANLDVMLNRKAQRISAFFYKQPNNYTINIKSVYNKQYTAGGDDGLIDGLIGDLDWRKGRWQGYQGQDFEAVVDLRQSKSVDSVLIGFLQDKRSWIFLPKSVRIFASNDSLNYTEIGSFTIPEDGNHDSVYRTQVSISNNQKETNFRYIKVVAMNYGHLPSWHPGAGGEAFIFIDEITCVSN